MLILPISGFAQSNSMNQQRIEMHQYMMNMQQQSIDCLNSGKSETYCRQQYRNSMKKMHNKYWMHNDDNYWDTNWNSRSKSWQHGCCNMMW